MLNERGRNEDWGEAVPELDYRVPSYFEEWLKGQQRPETLLLPVGPG